MSVASIAPGGARDSIDNYADYVRVTGSNHAQRTVAGEQETADTARPDQISKAESKAWGEDGFTFADVLDIINPLQHIPVVSDIYRAITGDEIAPAARMVGGGLLGGVPGLAVAAVNTVIEEVSGQDLGEMAMATLFGDEDTGDFPVDRAGTTAIAAAQTPEATVVAQAAAPATQAASAPARPVALQFASNDNSTTPGAAAGASAPAEQLNGGINFFNMNAARVTAPAARPSPGAIQNTLFTPLVPAPQTAAAEPGQTAKPAAPAPVPTNLVLANQTVDPQTDTHQPVTATAAQAAVVAPAQPRPVPSSQASSGVFADNGLTPEQQKKANRDALLAAARDLRAAFQSHKAFKTQDRLNTLQDQNNPMVRHTVQQ